MILWRLEILLAVVGGVALLSTAFLGAQAPPSSDLIRYVAAGGGILVVKADGSVVTLGRSPGRAISEPEVLDLPGKALKVAVGGANFGGFTGYALLEDGTVVAWGDNDQGQLGNGATGADLPLRKYPKPSVTPVKLTGLANIIDIAAGNEHAVALRQDGTVWMWGSGSSAMMGNGGPGTTSPDDPGGRNLLPLQVKGIVGAKHLAIGGGNAAALLGDSTLRMWGHNGYGESGPGSANAYEPRPVKTALSNVAAIYLGNMRSYAVRADGTFWIGGFLIPPGRPSSRRPGKCRRGWICPDQPGSKSTHAVI